MEYPQARLWLLLIGSLLSCQVSWAQDSSAKLADFNLVLGAEPYSTRDYLLAEMDSFTTTHQLQLLITLLDQEDVYAAYARQDEDALLAQTAPALVITTWHQGEGKYYQRCEVQLNKALATRLPQATARQLVEEMLNYYGKGDMMAQDAMNSGLTVALLKLSEYLNALPPPEAVPTITFANASAVGNQPALGLDALTEQVYQDHYEQVRINEEPYPVAWKALPSGGTTSVLAEVEKGVSFPPGVVFRQNGNTLSSQPATQNHQQQLTLTGQMHEQEGSLEVYASREEDAQLVGKLKTISYDVLYKKLVLVVLDDVTSDMLYLDRVSRAVQAIFAQAGVSLTIEIQKFDTEWVDRDVPLEDETTGMLSNYPKELKRVIKDYRQEHEQEAETAYIFLAGSSSTGKLGYMPKKRPYGFVYLNAHYYAEEVAKTIAHELGHGLFRLEHTFEAYPALSKGSTDNLMDYGKGTRLHKYQWDLVHDPKAMLGWFQDEEENAYYGDPYAYLWKEINELTSSINYSLYQFNQWVEESKRSILSLFDFSDVELTSDEAKVYEILTAVKEDDLESLSSYTAEEIITGQDLQLGEESYEKLIVYFLQAPTAIDTKSYQVEDKTEEGYSLLIFSKEDKADEEVLRVQVASEQKEALVVYLFGKEEKAEEEEATDDATYNFFVTDGDAWYREEEAPYKAITPVPSTNVLAKGLRVSVLETLKDNKDKDVAKIELKNSGTIEYTSLSNLSEVKSLSKELKYKMTKDYIAVKLPYSSESTDETYEKDKEFTVYKRCGDYIKVKGKGGNIKGHWIEKTAAVATEPEFEVKTEDLETVFTSADHTTRQKGV